MSSALKRLVLWFVLAGAAAAASPDRTAFDHSILAVPTTADPAHPRRGHVVRAALQASEQSAKVRFEIALRMRNFDELQARVAKGEQIGPTEMAEKYWPLAADETNLTDWLRTQGLSVDRVDEDHLAIFGSGTESAVAAAFNTTFARVATSEGEFTSAVTAPSLPADLAPAVLGIHGLQPHLHPHPMMQRPATVTPAASTSGYLPSQLLTAYSAASTGLTGSGQTIAVYAEAMPSQSDLSSFWTQAGSTASYGNIVESKIEGGPTAPSSDSMIEACLDVEWVSAIAPGAKVIVYASDENNEANFDLTFQQVYTDVVAGTYSNLHVFSISFGGYELEVDQDFLVIEAQYMANLASAGVSVFASSGDNGASPDGTLQVDYPADDPNVTGVGGTSLLLNGNNTISSETAWTPDSGGGASTVFARPSWQTGTGVPSGNYRLVPDVAAAANPSEGALVVEGGQNQEVGGTSWATPVWAGFAALMDQSRAANNLGPLGPMNPRLYPQLGTSCFRDITSGNNGTYVAGPGYDEVTGLGSPNVAAMIASGLNGSPPLAIVAQLPSVYTVLGQPATFYVVASGTAPFTFQWQRLPAGSSTWTNTTDDGNYSGSTATMLVIAQSTYAMNGDHYRCIVSNSTGSVTGAATALSVNPVGVTTMAGWPGSAGRIDGTGYGARFDFVGAVTSDSSGNLYVADGGGQTVRKVTPAGVVTTIAGQPGTAGWQDGTGTGALFNDPAGIALDPTGTIAYVADASDYTVRKVVIATGQVTTFAGTGNSPGTVNANGTSAKFENPSAMVSDSSGNLYIADGSGNTIRKVSSQGVVTTVAGTGATGLTSTGPATSARFNDPEGVAVDTSGNVYVGDTGNNCIRLINASTGQVSVFAGSASGRAGHADGTGTLATFDGPAGLRYDPNTNSLFVTDSVNSTIRQISVATAAVTTIAGKVGDYDNIDGAGTSAVFDDPGDLTVNAGVIYISDSLNFTIRRLVPGTLTAPTIATQPTSLTVLNGQTATFSVAVSSSATAPLAYQWQILPSGSAAWSNLSDGGVYSGSATAVLTIAPASSALSGNEYRCIVSNTAGSVTSNAATLTLSGAPTIGASVDTTAVVPGASVTLAADATGSGLSYQWYLNGTALPGATGSTYTISSFSSANDGTYTVTVTNSYGTASSTIAVLSVASTRLLNLSARSTITGGSILNVGFIIGGTGTKTVLLRGIGPALSNFGVSNALTDPQLKLLNSAQTQLGYNAGWGGSSALSSVFIQTGAFALTVGSADDALLMSGLPPGTYYSQVSSISGGTGAALDEIYEADTGTPTATLINLSVRAPITSSSVLTAGFVIGGTGTQQVLIRGIGPALANFSVTDYLTNPILQVYDMNQNLLATNGSWSTSTTTTAAQFTTIFTSVGAFALAPGSNDAAVLLSLAPGNYTAQLTTGNGAAGEGLIEIYAVPQ